MRKKSNKLKRNQELERDDRLYIWHPFTQMREWETEIPLIIERGDGVYLSDIYGKRYLDGVSSLWVNLHGHRQKKIDRAIIAQVKKIAHSTLLGLSNVPAIQLAKELIRVAPPGLVKVFYSDNGSTAMEIAIKMAFQYWQFRSHPTKTTFVSLINAYHGDTIGSVSIGGIDLFHKAYSPLLFPTFKVNAPYCYRCHLSLTYPSCQLACLEELEGVLRDHSEEIAGVVIEPIVQAAAGMLVWPPGYLARVRSFCDQYGVLLIADEVATGFGRTGKMFASQHEGVTPDIMAVAKGITGGYLPLAATLTTGEIYNAFLGEYREFKTFFHGHSYTGNPLGCVAALASLTIFKNEKVLQKMRPTVLFLQKKLTSLATLPHVGDVRQKGVMVGIELVRDKESKTPYPLEEKMGIRVSTEARQLGMITRPLGNVVVLMPPLTTPRKELGRMVEIIAESIKRVTG